MTNFTKSIFVALLLTATSAYADSSVVYYFQSLDPNIKEGFYCDVRDAADANVRVIGFNKAEIIRGFSPNGLLESNVNVLNTYYFEASHDANYPTAGLVVFKVDDANASIVCQPGTANRPVYPG